MHFRGPLRRTTITPHTRYITLENIETEITKIHASCGVKYITFGKKIYKSILRNVYYLTDLIMIGEGFYAISPPENFQNGKNKKTLLVALWVHFPLLFEPKADRDKYYRYIWICD